MSGPRDAWYARMREGYGDSPIHGFFGMELGELGPGTATVVFEPRPDLRNIHGTVHGGALAAVVDSAILQSVRTLLSDDEQLTTLEMKLNYLAPADAPRFVCRGEVVRLGGRVGVASATLYDDQEGVVTACLGTIYIRRRRP